MNLSQITAPTAEPVALSDVEGQVRYTLTDEASTVNLMIGAAREIAEGILNRALMPQVWELKLDEFPVGRIPIFIPMPPLQSVASIKYIDNNQVEQTLDSSKYRVLTDNAPNGGKGLVIPKVNEVWPVTANDVSVVTIRFTCGYLSVPAAIKQWILINVANMFENRETVGTAYRDVKFDMTDVIADGLLAKFRIPNL